MDVVEAKEGYVLLRVRVQPKSSRNDIMLETDGRLRVALTAPPVEGGANKSLCEYLSKVFDIPRRSVTVVRGDKSREKTVRLDGIGAESVQARLDKQKKGS